MPISKKARVQREHKAAEKAGTRAPVKANGIPVKAKKPTAICAFCRKELIADMAQLEAHALTHDQKNWPKEKCFSKEFPS